MDIIVLNCDMAMFSFKGTEEEFLKFSSGFWKVWLFASIIISLGLDNIVLMIIWILMCAFFGSILLAWIKKTFFKIETNLNDVWWMPKK